MNAPVDTACFGAEKPKLKHDPHHFRSRFLEKFAFIEGWAAQRLKAASPHEPIPASVGHKLEAVRKLPKTHPAHFKKPAEAQRLLEELRPYQALRTTLAHSTTATIRTAEGGIVYALQRADADPAVPCTGRTVIHDTECPEILLGLSAIANQLKQLTEG